MIRAVAPTAITAFWISSWFSIGSSTWAIGLAVSAVLLLLAALVFQSKEAGKTWAFKLLFFLAFGVLIGGAIAAFLVSGAGTRAEAAIVLFVAAGLAAFVRMCANVVARRTEFLGGTGKAGLVLVLLAAWSWAHAFAMYTHRGVAVDLEAACIIAPVGTDYTKLLTRLADMRLPFIVSTAKSRSHIWAYHAILVAPDNEPSHYNWSKLKMRFEPLDLQRNPYLPKECP
ncbi:hypothetical protein SAMN04488045_1772 [Thalassococcus halodurans]|uniref:Uncharacterized protein n=1 Tax=Thalassococcus halodurans TaxID=373675 RepID=A0A1H5X8T1_9RHOB|nr:hypothetical protein SAMN04488045_1772 [Thalassococcus halodurans]